MQYKFPMRGTYLFLLISLSACTITVEESDIFSPAPLAEETLDFFNTALQIDGERIGIRLNFPLTRHKDPRPLIFFLHGNSGNVAYWAHFTHRLSQSDARVIAVDYPGYGVSTGTPSLEGMRQSSLGVLEYLFSNQILTQEDTLVIYGSSLGSNPAIWLAADPGRIAQFDMDGLIIEAGLSNTADMITHTRSRIPLDFLVRADINDDIIIDNDTLIQTTTLNAFFIHGTEDKSIPPWMTDKLAFAAGMQPYGIWYVDGEDHIEPMFVADEEFDQQLAAYLDFASSQ